MSDIPQATNIDIPAWINGVLQPVEKLLVHQKGYKHKAVSVFIIVDGEILIQQRALCKYHTPGLWANTCCTHPAWNETSVDCAVRRLGDELGITDVLPEFRDQVAYRADVGGGLIEDEVVDVFVAELAAKPTMALNPDEVMNVRWDTMTALNAQIEHAPDRFTPWLKIYLDQFADRIF